MQSKRNTFNNVFAVKGVALKRHANVCEQKFIMA